MHQFDALARLAEDFADSMSVRVVYTHEAHPGDDTWQESRTTEDRIQKACQLQESIPQPLPVLIDPVEVSLARKLEIEEKGLVLINQEGEILFKTITITYKEIELLRDCLDRQQTKADSGFRFE